MGAPNWYFKDGKWYLRGKGDNTILEASDNGLLVKATGTMPNVNVGTLATVQRAKIGGGSQLSYVLGFTGSNAAITAVGTGSSATGTITNATGLAVGDKVFASPKVAVGGGVGIGGFHVPTTNTLNFYVVNPSPDSAGSFPARGWDVIGIRSA